MIQEILTLVSPVSRKQTDEDMAKRISKKKNRVVNEDEDVILPESPVCVNDMIVPSPKRDSPLKSNVEETGDLDGSVKTSIMDTTINLGDQSKASTPKRTEVIPPVVSNAESVSKEVRTSGSLRTYLIWMKMSIWVKQCSTTKLKAIVLLLSLLLSTLLPFSTIFLYHHLSLLLPPLYPKLLILQFFKVSFNNPLLLYFHPNPLKTLK